MGAANCCPEGGYKKSSLRIDLIPSTSSAVSRELMITPLLDMTDEQKDVLARHYRNTLLEQRPDIFHKTMLLSMQSSPKLNEIIACQMYCYRDLTKWPKLNSLCQAQLNFYDRLIYVLRLDREAVAEAVYSLGIVHYRYAQYGLKPHFLDLWQQHIQTLTSKVKFANEDEKELFIIAFDKLNSYITSVMNLAYLKCQMESFVARNNST